MYLKIWKADSIKLIYLWFFFNIWDEFIKGEGALCFQNILET